MRNPALQRHDLPGLFITFEGGEGTGKSTQARRLAARLAESGEDVVVTREPGGSRGAELVRNALLSGLAKPLGAEIEALLFSVARADHTVEIIRPALSRGAIVICDRYLDSTRAYQGSAETVDAPLVTGLEVVAVADTLPDLTILLDLPVTVGLQRAGARSEADRFERDTIEIHDARRKRFLAIAEAEPDRFLVLDAARSEDEIHEEITVVVQAFILSWLNRSDARTGSDGHG